MAEGFLEKNDGQSGNPNVNGHFDHYEYEKVNLEEKFKIIEKML